MMFKNLTQEQQRLVYLALEVLLYESPRSLSDPEVECLKEMHSAALEGQQ